jgi:hypothetical protein
MQHQVIENNKSNWKNINDILLVEKITGKQCNLEINSSIFNFQIIENRVIEVKGFDKFVNKEYEKYVMKVEGILTQYEFIYNPDTFDELLEKIGLRLCVCD